MLLDDEILFYTDFQNYFSQSGKNLTISYEVYSKLWPVSSLLDSSKAYNP